MRPSALVSLLIVGGVLASLPFRRSTLVDQPDPRDPSLSPLATNGQSPQSLSVTESGWGNRGGFDPSLAWQPLPMAVPGYHAPELPPMPDSYYDVSFEIQQPRAIQQERFPAAFGVASPVSSVRAPELPANETAAAPTAPPWTREPIEPAAATARPVAATSAVAVTTPPAGAPLPDRITADDMITDRFVYTPIAQPPAAASTGLSARQAAVETHRPNWAIDDPNRPKHYIREPE